MPGAGGEGGLIRQAEVGLKVGVLKTMVLKVFSHRLVSMLRPQPPRDARAGRLVAVIECVLNQNARDAGAATFPAMNWALLIRPGLSATPFALSPVEGLCFDKLSTNGIHG